MEKAAEKFQMQYSYCSMHVLGFMGNFSRNLDEVEFYRNSLGLRHSFFFFFSFSRTNCRILFSLFAKSLNKREWKAIERVVVISSKEYIKHHLNKHY